MRPTIKKANNPTTTPFGSAPSIRDYGRWAVRTTAFALILLTACRPEAATTTTGATTTTPTSTTTTIPRPHPEAVLTVPCPLPEETITVAGGDPVPVSQKVFSLVVCAATDVVVARPGDLGAAAVAASLAAPLVLADPERPFRPELDIARVWVSEAGLATPPSALLIPPDLPVRPPPPVPETGTVLALVDGEDLAGAVEATIASVGGVAVTSEPTDLRLLEELSELAGRSASRLLVGDFGDDAPWQFDVLAAGRRLPGGGQVLFPGRRIVALYGHPTTASLGVLGRQGPEEAVARAIEVAQPYGEDGALVVPAFEIIATVASARPEADQSYSWVTPPDVIRPWVEAATAAGLYVVLDLQPGRTDFLTQAKLYEEFLRLPNVGLALDPEWRLRPDQVHLRQIGSVSAAEINTVVDWLAGIVREERLPQKLLIVHQFKLSMITDRADIATPAELAVVIQMDGQGPLLTKYATWDALRAADGGDWWWGWKNFYALDTPLARPDQVLDLDPVPVFVSYQ